MIHSFDHSIEQGLSTGVLVKQNESVVWISGLKNVFVGESLISKSGVVAMVMSVTESEVCAMHFANFGFGVGEMFAATGKLLSVSVGEKTTGHVFDSLGYTYGGKEDSHHSESRAVMGEKKELIKRGRVTEFLPTGVAVLDLMLPLAKGQRELILGDLGVGKSSLARQVLATHIRAGGIGVMCMLGKSRVEIDECYRYMQEQGVSYGCVFVVEPSDSVTSRVLIAPQTAMTIAEFFVDQGKDVLVVLDDMTIHARKSREMSMLARNFPGRESYPIDIFWSQSSLLERSGCFSNDNTKTVHSITCLPIAETTEGNLSGYIETNLMSMTDGHIYMDKNLYLENILPAVSRTLSVTRVGKQVQPDSLKKLGGVFGKKLNDYENIKNFLKFGYELNDDAKETLRIATGISELLVQNSEEYYKVDELVSGGNKILNSK